MLEITASILLTLAAVLAYNYHQRLRGKLETEKYRYADIFSKLLLSEELRTKTQAELDFLKQLMSRPVNVTLDDSQVAMMTKALQDYWQKVYHKN